jgi:hypothetical protein
MKSGAHYEPGSPVQFFMNSSFQYAQSRHAVVCDLWSGAALGSAAKRWTSAVVPHDHRFVKITPHAEEL